MNAIGNVTSITVMFYFICAVLGVQLYSTLQYGDHTDKDANFVDFQHAISIVFRMSTGENWQGVMHDAAIEAPECGCVCMKDTAGQAGPQFPGFFECSSTESLDVDRFCGDSEAAVDTCGGYYTALAYYVSFFFLGGYCLLALFTAVILDCFSVFNHQDSSFVNIDIMKKYKNTWGKFDPYASGYIYLFWLKRRVGELERPLGFDPDRERSQWRLLYLERCSDTSSAAGGGSAARSWATGSRRG